MNDKLDALDRLAKLKASGAITEAEFSEGKRKIFQEEPPDATIPKTKSSKVGYVVGGIVVAGLIVVGLVVSAPTANKSNGTPPSSNTSPSETAAAADAPDACDSSDVADMVKGAIANSASSKLVNREVLDFGHAQELYFDKKNNVRFCVADAALNTGETKLSYRLFFGPSGGELVAVEEGEDAYDTKSMMATDSQTKRDPDTAPAIPNNNSTSTTDVASQRRLELASELRDARDICNTQGTEDHPLRSDEIAEMAKNQDTYFSNINQQDPTLMTDEDRKCWQNAQDAIKENDAADNQK